MTRVVIDNGGTVWWLTPLTTLLAVILGGLVNWFGQRWLADKRVEREREATMEQDERRAAKNVFDRARAIRNILNAGSYLDPAVRSQIFELQDETVADARLIRSDEPRTRAMAAMTLMMSLRQWIRRTRRLSITASFTPLSTWRNGWRLGCAETILCLHRFCHLGRRSSRKRVCTGASP